jgi:L-amino acid N-acyltransferase YncA
MLLAVEDEAVIGYTTYGSNRDRDVAAEVGEVRTFFVHPRAWRRGVGSALMGEALRGLPEFGYRHATVWSFADNARANAFYEHHGFARDGRERREDAWAGILEVRYRRRIA